MTEPTPSSEEPKIPRTFRLKPSRNQKQRSKLQQVADDPLPPAPAPAPRPVAPPKPAPPLRKMRLKRSGHVHEDLTKPLPTRAKQRDTEY